MPNGVPDAGNDAASASDAPSGETGATFDAGNDTAIAVPEKGFAVTLQPSHVTLDPGETTDVAVSVLRGSGFTDTVDVTVQGLGADLTTNPPTITIPSSSSQGTFTIKASTTPMVPSDVAVTILGVSKRDTSTTAQTALGVRIGSLLAIDTTSASHPLPTWASTLVVKVWGAGGGAGGAADTPNGTGWGSAGGGGGFASARLQVDPSLPLVVTVGTGGAPGMPAASIAPHGGGGGGYSAIAQGTTLLVVAGAGGGGAGGQGYNNSGQCYPDSFIETGGPGGGADAKPTNGSPNRSATATAPGVGVADGGASPGAALTGGAAKNPSIAGGVPGGGQGGLGTNACFEHGGGGGGGAGWFGGGGGASDWVTSIGFAGGSQSGGGGSGMVVAGASSVVQSAGSGASPAAATDPERPARAGAGGSRNSVDASTAPGGSGAVIVRFAKP